MDGDKPFDRGDWGRIFITILLALVVRSYILTRTEVAARDSIGFIRTALQFDEKPWAEVIRGSEQHPVYAIVINIVSRPVRWAAGGLNCDAMVLSAQLVSVLASLLTVFPVYAIGRSIFSRNAGWLAAMLLQVLPVFTQVTSDGLSEGVYFLWVTSGTAFAVLGLKYQSAWRFALAGIFAGLAYWTRPEGLLLAGAIGLVLLLAGFRSWGFRKTTLAACALTLGVGIWIGGYVGITGRLTNKPTPNDVLRGEKTTPIVAARTITTRLPLAVFWDENVNAGQSRLAWSLGAVAKESFKASNYAIGALALAGMVWFRRRIPGDPRLWLLILIPCLHMALLMRMAMVIGYVSERHTLMLVVVWVFWAAAVITEGTERILASDWAKRYRMVRWAPGMLVACLFLAGMPSIIKPLHYNRAGHHAAGVWIAKQIDPADEVVDPFCWAHFYAGCVFREGKVAVPPVEQRRRFVVIEQSSNPHSRLPVLPIAKDLSTRGERVYHWPENKPPERATVLVYRVDPGH